MRAPILAFSLCTLMLACSTKGISQRDYSTPEATFKTWKSAAESLDLKGILDSYAQSARPSMEQELARTTQESLESMQKETRQTKFQVEKIVFEDNLAYLRVRRKIRNDEGIEILTMVKEGDSWKLLP